MPLFDLLIKNGTILNPASGYRGPGEIAIAGGRIAAMGLRLEGVVAARVVDAAGMLVVPGLIDLHTHLGFELHTIVVDGDVVCPPSGVTTAVDMGSVGAFAFPWYRERVLRQSAVRLYSFINIASLGTIAIHTPYYVENYGRYIDIPDTIRMIEENREYIKGIKVFATSKMTGAWALDAVKAARQVGAAVGLPVAVHVSVAPPSLEEILALLQPGDIITHTYTPYDQGILDASGRVRAAVRAARERGVWFDLGHGAGSFTFARARAALAQDFAPDAISTDIYHANLETPVKDLLTTMSKFLALGMPLEEVLAKATIAPARILNDEWLGRLGVGVPADIAILSVQEGEFAFVDSAKETFRGQQQLQGEMTLCGGKIIYERGK
jgi:dihydroorotase